MSNLHPIPNQENRNRLFIISLFILSILSGPLFYFGIIFASGWSQVGFFGNIPFLLSFLFGGFISIAVWRFFKIFLLRFLKFSRITSLIIIPIIFTSHYIITLAVLPTPIKIWSDAFLYRTSTHIEFNKLQEWGEDVVNKYENQELEIDGKCNYYAMFESKLPDSEIPSWLENAWREKPQFCIANANQYISQSYVELSWYDCQIYIGRQNMAFGQKLRSWLLIESPYPGIIFIYRDTK